MYIWNFDQSVSRQAVYTIRSYLRFSKVEVNVDRHLTMTNQYYVEISSWLLKH